MTYGNIIHNYLSNLDQKGTPYGVTYNNHELVVEEHAPTFIRAYSEELRETFFLNLSRNVALRVVEYE